MKTREIDVWVNKEKLEKKALTISPAICTLEPLESGWIKATLIIEQPEPEITTTKTELLNAIQDVFGAGAGGEDVYERLFGLGKDVPPNEEK